MVRSLRAKLLQRLLVPMLLVTVAGGGLSYYMGLNYANDAYDQSLLDNARSVAREIENDAGRLRLDLPPQAVDMLQWDPSDHVFFRVDGDRDGLLAGSSDLVPARVEADQVVFEDSQIKGFDVREVTVGLLVGEHLIRVSVAETLNKRGRLTTEVLLAIILPQVLLIILVVIMTRLGVKQGLAPITDLEKAAHLRTPTDLTPLPEAGVPLELRPFTNAINGLLNRLGKAMDAQSGFIANAAHQLRTPLAALRVQIESALREDEPDRRDRILEQAIASLDRTERLANQLLLLARAETGSEMPSRFIELDLKEIVFEAGAMWVPKALQQGADLGLEVPDDDVPVHGDPLLLTEIVNNLIDNALRYAGSAPRITLRVEPGGADQGPSLAIEDDGPGIPVGEWEAVSERFYRVPGSPGMGTGLGLAIVREVARAHDAELTLEQPDAGGLRIRVIFSARRRRH
ncbi:MAG: sensor histidine kinase N-terminal domain-containing protein [Gallionellaceae bacterium]|nr:sensor histidine kinase N-terminal domain-containing protein [Gallionellaceae bacterium]